MNRAKAIALAVVPVALSVSGWAAAQQSIDFRPGFYVGGTVSRAEAKDACPGCEDNDTAWRVLGGYQFNPNLGVEVGYHDFGTFTSSAIGGVAPAGSVDARALEIVAVGTIPINPSFGVFGKAGAYRYDVDNNATGLSREGNKPTFGAGVRYNFTRNIAGRLEWQRYMDMGAINGDAQSDVDVVGLGVQVQF